MTTTAANPSMPPRTSSRLRSLLAGSKMLVAPGAYDGLTARLVEQAGFEACYMTGGGISASLGYPDIGLLTMTEMAGTAGVMTRAIKIPLIADADTGYGNELNITRTVREYEMRGVAGIHLEDQLAPKRCGHLDGKELVSREQFVSHIRAAVAARRDPDFVLIARTDARAVTGLDDAIDRMNAALDVGADVAFVEAPQSIDELTQIVRRVRGPCLFNMIPTGKTPPVTVAQAEEIGFRITIVPGITLRATIEGGEAALQALKDTGRPPGAAGKASDMLRRVGMDEWEALRRTLQAGAPAAMTETASFSAISK